MARAVTDLEANAALFWPKQLSEREQRASIIPRLIETQEKFIGILTLPMQIPRRGSLF